MKRRLLVRLLVLILLLIIYAQPTTVHAAHWLMTERVWDDERLQPNETFTWSGGFDREGFANGPGVLQWYVDDRLGNTYEGSFTGGCESVSRWEGLPATTTPPGQVYLR